MAAILTDDAHLSGLILSQVKVVVNFYSPLCEMCLLLTPQYRQLSLQPEYADILFLEINANDNPASRRAVNFREMPLIAAYHNGSIVSATPVYDVDGIKAVIEKLNQGHISHEAGDDCCGF